MKFVVVGSGGCVALPRPLCNCRICIEAREKGRPYSRCGCSLYLEDVNLLVDTPEDIVHGLNNSNIQAVDSVLFSHIDTDHTLGMRVFEQMRINWLEISEGKECKNPINVYALKNVMDDINTIGFKKGSYMDHYENKRNLIKRVVVDNFIIKNDIKISFVPVEHSTVFVFEQNDKKVIYAPCDAKPFPDNEIFNNSNVIIIGNTVVDDVLKDGFVLKENNWLRQELFVMDEIIGIKEKYKIEKVIMIHLEEDWGKSYDDYLELEKKYYNIIFSYDGMVIEV